MAKVMLDGRAGMPSFKDSLDDKELAAIDTYVRGALGNHAKAVSDSAFAQLRKGQKIREQARIH